MTVSVIIEVHCTLSLSSSMITKWTVDMLSFTGNNKVAPTRPFQPSPHWNYSNTMFCSLCCFVYDGIAQLLSVTKLSCFSLDPFALGYQKAPKLIFCGNSDW